MGFLKKINELIGVEEIEEDEEETVVEEKKNSDSITKTTPLEERMGSRPSSVFNTIPPAGQPSGSVSANTGKYTTPFKIVIIEPRSFDDSPKLVDSLKAKKPVVINLENIETSVARKIFDFLSGATYALNGNVQKITNNIFMFTPENVDVSYNQNLNQPEAYKSAWK